MAFNLLYNDNISSDEVTLLTHINEYTKGLGIQDVEIYTNKIRSILMGMRHDFPHIDGLEKASAFKKIANFVVYFCAERPIKTPFPVEAVGHKLAEIDNHQNSIVSLHIAIDSLHGATINQGDNVITLENRIQLSQHSFIDIVEALQSVTPSTHYKLITVLFEQLAYKTNPSCQYPMIEI